MVFHINTETKPEHLQVSRLSWTFQDNNWIWFRLFITYRDLERSKNHLHMARKSEQEKQPSEKHGWLHLHLLIHEHSYKSKQTQQVHYICLPTCKHLVYGKQPGYLPTSEAITVMLCQGMSSLSRGCVVLITPLLSSILKYRTSSSLLSKKYLLGKETNNSM